MERLLIKKLIVISEFEKTSREIELEKGLNIIIGINKTGKSSLIKSIFYSFGCDVLFEDVWKKLVNKYLIYFKYGSSDYCITREKKHFKLFIIMDSSYQLLCDTEKFHVFCSCLMKIMDVTMDCLTNKGVKISATSPLLFRFQYIDQDTGWGKNIGESFSNMKYVEQWKSNTNKYVVGYQGEEYYLARQELNILKDAIEKTKVKLNHFSEMLILIKKSYSLENLLPIDKSVENENVSVTHSSTKKLFDELNDLEKKRINLDEEISSLMNLRYEKNLQLITLKNYVQESENDHSFAMDENDSVTCPFCGTMHQNTTIERLEIVKDIQSGNQLLKQTRDELKEIDSLLLTSNQLKIKQNSKYGYLKKNLENRKDSASIIKTYRDEGKTQIISSGNFEKQSIEKQLFEESSEKISIENRLTEFNSGKRRKAIIKEFRKYYEEILSELNVPITSIKLLDFVQKTTKLGSDMPRITYAFHISMYLYNLNRIQSPFNLLVIDTPNQQGQDEMNLHNIDSVLTHLLDDRGQVIIGTERETGYEDKATKVIRLSQVRRCLSNEKYNEHINLFLELSIIEENENSSFLEKSIDMEMS
jgi:hypothetical protein